MSHNKLRTEKTCLNCGHTVEERYCPQCGQENIELHDSAFHLFIHFVQDIFHYDGKFWHTFRVLIRKPGQVAAEYIDGKRVHNIQPIRFYFFTSTIFFLLLFYMVNPDDPTLNHNPASDLNKRMYFLQKEKQYHIGNADTVGINNMMASIQKQIDSVNVSIGDSLLEKQTDGVNLPIGDTLLQTQIDKGNASTADTFHTGVVVNPTFGEPDNTENPDSAGWLKRIFDKRWAERKKEFEERNPGVKYAGHDMLTEFFHKLPQLIFLSLPFFAFFLKILYFKGKRTLYVEHLIFSIYQYSYLYAMLTVFWMLNWVTEKVGSVKFNNIVEYVQNFIVIYLFIYLMLAMKRFYLGRWRYLLPKYFILMFLMMFTIIFLAALVGVVTYLL